jgi:hypothetical protein
MKRRIEYQDAATERARAFPGRKAIMCFEHVAMGPAVQGAIASIPAVPLHGPPRQARLTVPRADPLRRGRDGFLTADSIWRHIS